MFETRKMNGSFFLRFEMYGSYFFYNKNSQEWEIRNFIHRKKCGFREKDNIMNFRMAILSLN